METLYFHEIIGTPLRAIIEGETLAAQATAQFIKEIGFFDGKNEDDFGSMRMVTFSYEKTDEEGNIVIATIQVPLLSILPIPMMQIKQTDLDYNISITSIEDDKATETKKLRTIFRENNNGETSQSYNIKINMQVEQSDIPVGLSKMFNIMENAVTETTNTGTVEKLDIEVREKDKIMKEGTIIQLIGENTMQAEIQGEAGIVTFNKIPYGIYSLKIKNFVEVIAVNSSIGLPYKIDINPQ